jgi:hypothetical protein
LASASVADTEYGKATALADYFLLTFVQGNQSLANVGKSISMADPTVSKTTSRDGYLNLADLVAAAKAACAEAGVIVGGSSWSGPVDLNLDFLEPWPCLS